MGLPTTILRLIINTLAILKKRFSALSYGIQDIYANYEELRRYFEELGEPYQQVPSRERRLSESRVFSNPAIKARKNVHASVFFKMLGFNSYSTLDLLEIDGIPDIKHDLNLPIPVNLEGAYDFVLDGGTLEHIFDIKTALCNTARLVSTGGVVIHHNPVTSYDHGFYGINPTLLIDFYAANGFKIVNCVGVVMDQKTFYEKQWCFPYHELIAPLANLSGSPRTIGLFFCAQRISEDPIPCISPIQGFYNRIQTEINLPQSEVRGRLKNLKSFILGLLPLKISSSLCRLKMVFDRWLWYRRNRFLV